MKQSNDTNFEKKLADVLDQSAEQLDEATRYRLQVARAQALDSGERATPWYKRWHTWASATGVASIFSVVFLVTSNFSTYPNNVIEFASDTEITLTDDDVGQELYEEYEFYVWLSQQEIRS